MVEIFLRHMYVTRYQHSIWAIKKMHTGIFLFGELKPGLQVTFLLPA